MPRGINHALEAKRLLPGWHDAMMPNHIAAAQVHATLALVEQQRIANLIALHAHEVAYDIGEWSRIYHETADGPALNDDIREGLGL